jgi:rSAM/selenodomain-associated transferase 1
VRHAAEDHRQDVLVKNTVYVFARAPRLGTVKRRLAAGIGAIAALRFYRTTLAMTLRRLAADRRFRTMLAVTPDGARGPWRRGLPVAGQGGGDLGARMHRIARHHARSRVAIVGADIPDLRADDVAAAFRMLRAENACFGPAEDGGYWLVALGPRRPACPFARVRWSGRHALADTLLNFRHHSVAFVRALRDVDTEVDLKALPS